MDSPIVLAWCDDLFLQGHQLSKWIVDYVDLEESLAIGSIAQELLAHSAALMGMCGLSTAERDERVYRRPVEQWYPSKLSLFAGGDWPACVARAFLLNRAMLVLRDHLVIPDRPRVQQLAEVINAEQDLHARHWERWVAIFGSDHELRSEFAERCALALDDAGDLFGEPDGLAAHDELLDHDQLAAAHLRWRTEVSELLNRFGFAPPAIANTARARTHHAVFMAEVVEELRFARRADGTSYYEVYQ